MSNLKRFEEALNSADAHAVYQLATELRDSALSPAELLATFDELRVRHHDDTDEQKYNAVLDVMDLIVV